MTFLKKIETLMWFKEKTYELDEQGFTKIDINDLVKDEDLTHYSEVKEIRTSNHTLVLIFLKNENTDFSSFGKLKRYWITGTQANLVETFTSVDENTIIKHSFDIFKIKETKLVLKPEVKDKLNNFLNSNNQFIWYLSFLFGIESYLYKYFKVAESKFKFTNQINLLLLLPFIGSIILLVEYLIEGNIALLCFSILGFFVNILFFFLFKSE